MGWLCSTSRRSGRDPCVGVCSLLLARAVCPKNPGRPVVIDVKSTGLYFDDPVLKASNTPIVLWKTGHSYIKAKVAELTQRLNESESRLAASRNRVRDLTANNAQLASQMSAYDSTIASFKTIIDNQKTEIASLTEQINALQAENTTLKAEKATLEAAARSVGFDEIAFQYEPIAAAFGYERALDRDELVLIGDFGGGTSDFCLARLGPGQRGADRSSSILAVGGVPLAGDCFERMRFVEDHGVVVGK